MLRSLAFRLWNGCPALAFKGPGCPPCVRVCCCWASALGADQWRLAAGGQAAIHLSSAQLCNLRKKEGGKKIKKREKGRGAHVLRQILQVLFFIFLFNIVQRKVPCVCVCVTSFGPRLQLLFLFFFFFFFFFYEPQTQPEHPEASQAIKPRSVTNEMHRRSTVRITSGSNYLFTRRVSRGSDVLKTNRRNGFLIDYCVAASFSSCLWTDDRSACLLIQITPAV